MVPSLAVPVSQTVDQLVAVIKHVDSAFAEQLIAVPRISWPSRFPPTVLHEPQKAEQLVEVPTTLFFLKQTVDTRGGYGGLKGFHPEQGSLQRTLEQIVDIPVPGGELQDFPPDAGPAAPAWLFEGEKKCGGCWESECEGARALELIHAAAHHDDVVSPSFFLQLAEQDVDIPVLGRGVSGCGGLQGFHPEQSSLQPSVELNVDIPVLGGGLPNFPSG